MFCIVAVTVVCPSMVMGQSAPVQKPAGQAADPASESCVSQGGTPVTQKTYSDPFEYCLAIGTIDMPDKRYDGEKIPDAVVKVMVRQGIVSADAPPQFQRNALWRCMDHSLWVCHFGANIPCTEKADMSRAPTSGMKDYCKANPSADNIPAYAAGRATAYEWKCNNGKPELAGQLFKSDSQGYPAVYWYKLKSR